MATRLIVLLLLLAAPAMAEDPIGDIPGDPAWNGGQAQIQEQKGGSVSIRGDEATAYSPTIVSTRCKQDAVSFGNGSISTAVSRGLSDECEAELGFDFFMRLYDRGIEKESSVKQAVAIATRFDARWEASWDRKATCRRVWENLPDPGWGWHSWHWIYKPVTLTLGVIAIPQWLTCEVGR